MKQFFNTLSLGFFLAIRQVTRGSKWATGLIIFIMMLTFLNFVATSGLLVGIVEGVSRAHKEQWSGELFIETRNENDYIEHTDDILSVLSSFPQVKSYSPRLIAGAKIEANWQEKRKESDENSVSNQIAGIDPDMEDATTHLSDAVVEGEWLRAGDTRGIVIGSGYLAKYSRVADLLALLKNVQIGDTVRVTVSSKKNLVTPEQNFSVNPDLTTPDSVTQDFIVRGIVDSKVQFVVSRAYILDTELKKMLRKNDGDVSEISIILKPGIDPYEVKTPLVDNGFEEFSKINTAEEGSPEFLVNIRTFFTIIGTILGSISVVVGLITIFVIIYINALTRKRQIGILKAVGVTEFAIEFSYICQALFYVTLGSFLATFLVFFVIKPLLDIHPINTPFAEITLATDYLSVAFKFMLVFIVSILAGYIPAKIIVNTNTLDAILGRNK